MSDPVLDSKLREFLEAEHESRSRGHTAANIMLAISSMRQEHRELAARYESTALRHELRLDRHGQRLKKLENRLDFAQDEMDTGTHQIADLQRALADKQNEINERKADSIWWRRQKWQWLVAALGALALVGITTTLGVLGFFIARSLSVAAPQQQQQQQPK